MEAPHLPADVEPYIEYLQRLPSQLRRQAFSARTASILSIVHSLSSCPRCAFIKNVLGVFMPHTFASGDNVLQSTQLESLLSSDSLVNLLQFVWPHAATRQATTDASDGHAAILLSDSVALEYQLMRNFLDGSLRFLADAAGECSDCSRHAGTTSPDELQSTARRLKCQEQDIRAQMAQLELSSPSPSPSPPQQGPPGAAAATATRYVYLCTQLHITHTSHTTHQSVHQLHVFWICAIISGQACLAL